MAQSYVTDAGTIYIPSSTVSMKVSSAPSGLSATGVLMLVGEADAGPDFTLETDLQNNAFGPDQAAEVIAKYGSGPLVDAFLSASQAANDPDITASFSTAIMVKTNPSRKAYSALLAIGGGAYTSLQDKSYGKLGNLIYYTITQAVPEIPATTGLFTWSAPAADFDMDVVLDGVKLGPITVVATTTASAFKTQLEALGLVVTIAGSDLTVSAPAALVPGAGKTLEIVELTTAVGTLSASVGAVAWVSKLGSPQILTSAAEQKISLNTNRQRDNIQEELLAGGEIALKISYTGTSAIMTITDTALTTTVVGGAGASKTITLADFPTIQDLATYINSLPGYSAAVGTAILGQLPSSALDNVTALGINTSFGVQTGRVKIDNYRFQQTVANDSVLVQLASDPGVGLPALVASITYLAGGTKAGTLDADVTAALLALEKVRGNFLIPLFSRDSGSDITAGLTDSTSVYTIVGINTAARSHVLKMSTLKRSRNRQAFLSIKDTFAVVKDTSANTASFRCAMPFMDVRNPNSAGTVTQFAPWMGAVVAASMQAGAFYKGIVRKGANIVGALQASADFDPEDDTAMEEALKAGLLPMRRADTGGWYWVSDQTTYGKDNNFVYNSIQATYVADIIALTSKSRMEKAFVGQSVADISATLASAFVESLMEEFLRLKLIARSDDAVNGYRNLKIKINGNALVVSCEVKLAGLIYFVPINFLMSQVVQTA